MTKTPDSLTGLPAPQTVVSPRARMIRTVVMVVLAAAAAVPAAVATMGFSAETAGKIVALAGGVTVLVTAVWNALEGSGLIPTLLGKTIEPANTSFTVNGEKVGPGDQATLKAPAKKAAVSRPKAPRR